VSVVTRRLSLGEPERLLLAAEAVTFGFSLDTAKLDGFCRFADLLGLWSTRMSLISCRTGGEIVGRHFVDSLAVGPWIRDAASVVDLGSGAGFPGIPLAITHPEKQIILVESRRRRANFLREAKRTLGLSNARVVEARAEDGSQTANLPVADAVVCRAVWSGEGVLLVAPLWLRPGGVLICMRARSAHRAAEIAAAGGHAQGDSERVSRVRPSQTNEVFWERSTTYRIGTGRRRTLDIYRCRASS
jgi:16S rRNA (guanine527-N7)-methyltransferase